MASAKKVPAVTETKVVEVEPEKVVLELTVEEAEILRAVTGKGPISGRLHPIYRALDYAGVVRNSNIRVVQGDGQMVRGLRVVIRGEEELW